MKSSNQTTAPEPSAKASSSGEPKKKSASEPLTKAALSDETERVLRDAVGEKEMGDAAVAFVRAEVLSLLKRKVTQTFVLKVRAKRHRQLAVQIEEAIEAAKEKKKVTTNASTDENNATTVPAA